MWTIEESSDIQGTITHWQVPTLFVAQQKLPCSRLKALLLMKDVRMSRRNPWASSSPGLCSFCFAFKRTQKLEQYTKNLILVVQLWITCSIEQKMSLALVKIVFFSPQAACNTRCSLGAFPVYTFTSFFLWPLPKTGRHMELTRKTSKTQVDSNRRVPLVSLDIRIHEG